VSAPDEVRATRAVRATPATVWSVLTDVRRIPELAPALHDTEWAQGSTGPAVGAVFASHVDLPIGLRSKQRDWFYFRVTRCEPEQAFEFENVAGRVVTVTGYELSLTMGGSDVATYTRLPRSPAMDIAWRFAGRRLRRRYERELGERLDRLQRIVEAPA
jgi:uncharacterized protein YndB with AHSA1/START domain